MDGYVPKPLRAQALFDAIEQQPASPLAAEIALPAAPDCSAPSPRIARMALHDRGDGR